MEKSTKDGNKKSKLGNFLFWILGFSFAELWRYLLKGTSIPEFFKWLSGIAIIIIAGIIITKIEKKKPSRRSAH